MICAAYETDSHTLIHFFSLCSTSFGFREDDLDAEDPAAIAFKNN